MAIRKITKKKNLPKGISWREDRKKYIGRFTFKGNHYVLYDTEWKRLERRLIKLRYDVKEGHYNKLSDVTLNEWFDHWMKSCKLNCLRASTYRLYTSAYRCHVKDALGKNKLKDIKMMDMQSFYNELLNKNVSPSFILHIRKLLGACFKGAMKEGLITSNPAVSADCPKGEEPNERYVFTVSEQKEFLKLAKENPYGDFLIITLMTGMRKGESQALRWKDIDFENKLIHVNHTLVRTPGKGYYLESPKTKSSKRVIPMLPQVEEILLRRKQMADKAGLGDESYALGLANGLPLKNERISKAIKTIEKQMREKGMKIGHITCHTLRHVFATRAIEGGMNPQVLKSILGHASINITMDLYSHVLGETKVLEMNLIQNMF